MTQKEDMRIIKNCVEHWCATFGLQRSDFKKEKKNKKARVSINCVKREIVFMDDTRCNTEKVHMVVE